MAFSSATISVNSNPITAGNTLNVTISVVGSLPANPRREYYFNRNSSLVADYVSNTATRTYSVTAQSSMNGSKWAGTVIDFAYDVETGEYVYINGGPTSNSVTLTVYWLPTLSAALPSAPLKAVGKTVTFSSSISSHGNPSSGYVYQWQKSTDGGSNYTNISGANSLSYTTPNLTLSDNGNMYRLRVSRSGVSGYKYSTAATLAVSDKPILTAPTTLQVSANPLTQDNITLNWTKSSDTTEILAQSALKYEIQATLVSDTNFTDPFYTFVTDANAGNKTVNLRELIKDPQGDTLLSGQYAYGAYKFRVRATVDYDYNNDSTPETYVSAWTVLSNLTYDYRIAPSAPSVTLPAGDIYEGQTISVTWNRPSAYNAYDEDGNENVLTYITKTALNTTFVKKWSGESEVPIIGGVTAATVTENVIVENVTSGADLNTTVHSYCVDAENQTGANSSSQSVTIKRHRKPMISVANDVRAEGKTTLYIDVTDTGYGGSQSANQIYSFEYSINGGASWTEILYANVASWDGMRAEFDVTGLVDNVSTNILIRATNTAPNANTPRLTNSITYTTMPYTPIAYVYTSETEDGFIARNLRVGDDFSGGHQVWHAGNLNKDEFANQRSGTAYKDSAGSGWRRILTFTGNGLPVLKISGYSLASALNGRGHFELILTGGENNNRGDLTHRGLGITANMFDYRFTDGQYRLYFNIPQYTYYHLKVEWIAHIYSTNFDNLAEAATGTIITIDDNTGK